MKRLFMATALNIKLNLVPQSSELILNDPNALDDFHVIIIPGGFGSGTEGKIETIQYCREKMYQRLVYVWECSLC